MPRNPLESEIYKFRYHVEAAIVAALEAANMVHPRHQDRLLAALRKEHAEIDEEIRRGGPPGRLPVRELLERLGIRPRRTGVQ